MAYKNGHSIWFYLIKFGPDLDSNLFGLRKVVLTTAISLLRIYFQIEFYEKHRYIPSVRIRSLTQKWYPVPSPHGTREWSVYTRASVSTSNLFSVLFPTEIQKEKWHSKMLPID